MELTWKELAFVHQKVDRSLLNLMLNMEREISLRRRTEIYDVEVSSHDYFSVKYFGTNELIFNVIRRTVIEAGKKRYGADVFITEKKADIKDKDSFFYGYLVKDGYENIIVTWVFGP